MFTIVLWYLIHLASRYVYHTLHTTYRCVITIYQINWPISVRQPSIKLAYNTVLPSWIIAVRNDFVDDIFSEHSKMTKSVDQFFQKILPDEQHITRYFTRLWSFCNSQIPMSTPSYNIYNAIYIGAFPYTIFIIKTLLEFVPCSFYGSIFNLDSCNPWRFIQQAISRHQYSECQWFSVLANSPVKKRGWKVKKRKKY